MPARRTSSGSRQRVVGGRPRWWRRSAPRRRCTSNSSTCRPSTACGSRGPRRISRSGPGDRGDHLARRACPGAAHPGPDLPVAEPHHPLVPHPHRALDADRPGGRGRRGRRRSASRRGPGTAPVAVVYVVSSTALSPDVPAAARRASSGRAEQPAAVLAGRRAGRRSRRGSRSAAGTASRPSRPGRPARRCRCRRARRSPRSGAPCAHTVAGADACRRDPTAWTATDRSARSCTRSCCAAG